MRFEGWAITGCAGAAMVLLTTGSLATLGAGEDAAREVVRWTARCGAVVLAAAFAARPMRQLWANDASKWLLRNRRYVGMSFAVMHFTHLAALAVIATVYPEPFRSEVDPVTLFGGGAAYVLLIGMTITSFDRTAAMIGRRAWKILHVAGIYTLWFVMTLNYTTGTFAGNVGYAPLSLMLFGALALRSWAHFGQRSKSPALEPS